MRHLKAFSLLMLAVLWAAPVRAQHSDVEFGYSGGQIEIENTGPEGRVFEGDIPTSGLFMNTTDDPGFGSEISEGLGINPNNIIGYNVLQNLFFWNGTAEQTPTASLTIENAVGPDTVVNATSGFQGVSFASLLNLIGQADTAGDFHSHVDFTLSSGAPLGAYGLLWSLASDDPSGIADSDPFGILFNYGLDEEEFEAGVEYFVETRGLQANTTPIPEPSSWLVFAITGVGLLAGRSLRRRARKPRQ